jgi:hypothetical protein
MANTPFRGPMQQGVNLDLYQSTQIFELGTVVEGANGKKYRYVQFLDAVTYQLGDVCLAGGTALDDWKVTNNASGGSVITGQIVVGVLHGIANVPVQNDFGWVQIAGQCAPRGTYVAGDYLKPHASNNGQAVVSGYTAAKADFNIFAKAITAAIAILAIGQG